MKPKLISFKLCPFVQRSVILLLEKGTDFDITYIDLKDPPDWFGDISPLGKVPVLQVGDEVVFESAVIMEYLDEVNPPSLHPADPLKKAKNRAWIEFASTLFMAQFNMTMAKTEEDFTKAKDELKKNLGKLNQQITGPMFNGTAFNLVDAAFAPLFMRLRLLESWHTLGLEEGLDAVTAWADTLLERDSVKNSVVEELPQLYRKHIGSSGGYGAKVFGND